MRVRGRQSLAGDIRKQPNEARGFAIKSHGFELRGGNGGNDTGKSECRDGASEVSQGATLHVDKRLFARGMHDLEDELAGIIGDEMEIIVVFAG